MASDNASMRERYITRSFLWPFRWAFWLSVITAALWTASVASHIYFSHRMAEPGMRASHIQGVLRHDMEVLAQFDTRWVNAPALAWSIGREAYGFTFDFVLFAMRTVMNLPASFSKYSGQAPQDKAGDWLAGDVVPKYSEQIAVALSANYVFGARVALLIAMMPLIALAFLIAWIDGWVGRAIRRARAGRESSAVYHRAKAAQLMLFAATLMVHLGLPCVFSPSWLLLPLLLCALGARVQMALYKKYL